MDFLKLGGGVYVVILILWLIVDYFIANQFENIAKEKGFPQKRYFIISYFLYFVGWIMVAALPDRGVQTMSVPSKENEEENKKRAVDEYYQAVESEKRQNKNTSSDIKF